MQCYCGSKNEYSDCCDQYINHKKSPETPEQLMRSRYTAYVIKNCEYILETYSKDKKMEQSIDEITSWANETSWLHLNIVNSSPYKNVKSPTVQFEAIYRKNSKFFKMYETSSFILEDKKWCYMDGDNLEFISLNTPTRNDSCLCMSGKKFKKCCGR